MCWQLQQRVSLYSLYKPTTSITMPSSASSTSRTVTVTLTAAGMQRVVPTDATVRRRCEGGTSIFSYSQLYLMQPTDLLKGQGPGLVNVLWVGAQMPLYSMLTR